MNSELPAGFTRRGEALPMRPTTIPARVEPPRQLEAQFADLKLKAQRDQQASDRRRVQWTAIGLTLLFCVGMLIVAPIAYFGFMYYSIEHGGANAGMAYRAACQFIRSEYPGVEVVDAQGSALINRDGRKWTVVIGANGKNSMGGPVRNGFKVEMSASGGSLDRIWITRVDPPTVSTYSE